MGIQQSYNAWAEQYDTNINKTRDLEAVALRQTLAPLKLNACLEIGCGTGKNTVWLAEKAASLTSVDFSEEMLQKAKEKVTAGHVKFIQADINKDWHFAEGAAYNLVSFSLVLEHISDIDAVFSKTVKALKPGGYVYIGELHPFKQYAGSKARFDAADGTTHVVDCYTHHVSDFIAAAKKHGLAIEDVKEYFDEDDITKPPRLLVLLLKRTLI